MSIRVVTRAGLFLTLPLQIGCAGIPYKATPG